MIQRIRDWLLEREIRKLGHASMEAYNEGCRDQARYLWAAQCKAIARRSTAQIVRMERRMGLDVKIRGVK